METFDVEVQITYNDYAKAMWFKFMRIGGRAWPAYLLLALTNAAMLGYAAYAAMHWGIPSNPVHWLAIVLAVLYIPLYLSIRYLYIRLGFGLKRDRCCAWKYTFSEAGIRAEKSGGKTPAVKEYMYGEIDRLFETREAFYIDAGEGEYLIAPKRGLGAGVAEKAKGLLAEKLRIAR